MPPASYRVKFDRWSRRPCNRGLPRVLVVDDNPDVALAIGYVLEAHGYAVAQAISGKEALDTCRCFPLTFC